MKARMTPLIVIIDQGSASASEFVAVALEEGRGAILAGKRSRGKALIQGLFPLALPADGGGGGREAGGGGGGEGGGGLGVVITTATG